METRFLDPESTEYRSEPELVRATAALQLELWQGFAQALPFDLVDVNRVVTNPLYRNFAPSIEPPERRVSAHEKLRIFPEWKTKEYGALAKILNCDAVIVVDHRYSFHIEDIKHKPNWSFFIESSMHIVGPNGNDIWRTLKLRGRSSPAKAEEGVNLLVFRFSKIDRGQATLMMVEAMEDQFSELAIQLSRDVREAAEATGKTGSSENGLRKGESINETK